MDALRSPDDLLNMVLRGHLLVEEQLDRAVRAFVQRPQDVDAARLTFFQKIQLTRAFNIRHPDEPVWRAVAALNVLRNDLAHRLTSSERDRKARELITSTREDYPGPDYHAEEEEFTIPEQLQFAIGYLLGALNGIAGEYEQRARVAKEPVEALLNLEYDSGEGAEE